MNKTVLLSLALAILGCNADSNSSLSEISQNDTDLELEGAPYLVEEGEVEIAALDYLKASYKLRLNRTTLNLKENVLCEYEPNEIIEYEFLEVRSDNTIWIMGALKKLVSETF